MERFEEIWEETEWEQEFELEEKPWFMRWALPFLVSAVAHVFMAVVALLFVFEVWQEREQRVLKVFEPNQITPHQFEDTPRIHLNKTTLIEDAVSEDVLSVVPLEQEEPETKDIPKGTSFDNLSNKNLNSTAYIDVYGAGGGRAGRYGVPWGHHRYASASRVEDCVVPVALRWLWRHQNRPDPDRGMSADDPECGGWDVVRFDRWCRKSGACPNNNPVRPGAVAGFNVAVTGLATLAFLGCGNTHLAGDFRRTVKLALEYLIRKQDSQGWIGRHEGVDEWIYNHAIATMALCEAYAMTNDPWLDEPCRKAVECIVESQTTGAGWRYTPGNGESDTSVTGWMVLALKAARNAGIPVPESTWQGALSWFDRCFNPATGWTGYRSKFDKGSVIPGVNDCYERLPTMTSVAVICRIFCGQSRKDRRIRRGVQVLMKHLPQWNTKSDSKARKVDMYYWYYATLAMFQFGGPKWQKWSKALREALIRNQRRGGCADGSWDPVGKWGMVGGRVYATAINALTLEVYYRYLRYKVGVLRKRRRRYLSD